MTTCMGQTRMKMTMENNPPLEILAELRAIEREILQGIEELEGMLR